ncbi:cupin domain-containing protein [Nocardiopsis synnemataformans]|uniref:cupin domain-containing protein n=1 Tax=Nocardiopsis synnemataformans TaxID=61305 RepID=UPI003EBE672E
MMMMENLLDTGDVRLNAVVFQPGCRTGWHYHTGGQLFIVDYGRGVVVSEDTVFTAQAGDIVYSSPGERHWHGASPDSMFVYTVLSLGDTLWVDKDVSEEAYLAAFG